MRIETRWARWTAMLLLGAVVISGGWWLMHRGVYGLALFVVIPVIIGALAEGFQKSAGWRGAAKFGALAVLLINAGLLGLGIEGLVCIAMSVPLTVPLGAIGGCLAYGVRHSRVQGNRATAALLILPLSAGSVGFDVAATPAVYEAHTSVDIAATPEQVWKYVVSYAEMAPPDDWMFKAGIAYPERVRVKGIGVGAVRYCDFSTGPLVEPIGIWDEPRLLQFSVTETPAPMREWSLYTEVNPKHLHGYFISKQGQFRLTPMANGHTLLEGRSWYQHGLWPAQYWKLWSDAVVHRVHRRVLTHIKVLAESDAREVQ